MSPLTGEDLNQTPVMTPCRAIRKIHPLEDPEVTFLMLVTDHGPVVEWENTPGRPYREGDTLWTENFTPTEAPEPEVA